jgi:hypothetical protein
MHYKIIVLAIDTLLQLAAPKGNDGQFNRDLDDAIKSLRNVKKYL